ncbi:MAG TPA: class I SAM-dependent methyltransferase [Candidatus Acidoferrales bacterium]|nr:class I SAM-dependent methyltransferase [Candidatus Acidoferrales bacterium]
MDPQYGSYYRELYHGHWWWRSREEAILCFLRSRFSPSSSLRILDVGCGDALFFPRLAEFGDVEGIEPDSHLVNPSGPYASKIHITPFDRRFQPGKRYHLLLMLDVLEHLEDPAGALACAHALLEPGGVLLLTVPALRMLWTNHDVMNHHRTRYRRATLFPLLRQAGFSIACSQYWYQWTVPAKLAIALSEKLAPREPVLPPIPPPWLNRLLFFLSRVEQETLGALAVPFGSTLMVCAARE